MKNILGIENVKSDRVSKKKIKEQLLSSENKILINTGIEMLTSVQKVNVSIITKESFEIFRNEEYNYSEILVLDVILKDTKNLKKINDVFHKIFQNPLILNLHYNDEIMISVCNKRINKNNPQKAVCDKVVCTPFFSDQKDYEKKFIDSMNVKNQNGVNLFEYYNEIKKLVELTKLFEIINNYFVCDSDDIFELLNECIDLISKIEKLKRQLKKEKDIGFICNMSEELYALTQKLDECKGKIDLFR